MAVSRIDLAAEEDRFSRLRLISWWDQARLNRAKALVIGAGALGNEILKNLALLGVGKVFIADMDQVEISNLSRSVLFRASDCGQNKVDVVASRARELYPEMQIRPFNGNIVYQLGLGVFRWADLILGGLDNREARVAMNQAAAKLGKPWIDGAIERLDGVARVFDPATGPCYECTMSETDWKLLAARRSCALLSREEATQGRVPTTPTTASIIAGIQVQEGVKLLHGLPTMAGKGFQFDGLNHQSYLVTYTRQEDCPSHEAIQSLEVLPWTVDGTTVGELLAKVRADLGPQAVVDLNQDLLSGLQCETCQEEEVRYQSLHSVTAAEGNCPRCGNPRAPRLYHTLTDHLSPQLTLGQIGVPPWDVVMGRCGLEVRHYEFGGDRRLVLGDLADKEDLA